MISPPRLPPPVGPGDRVGVAALSGPVDGQRLEAGLEALRELGFEPVVADNLRQRHQLFAGSDEERLGAFHDLAADPALGAIVFARGGWGVLRLLDRVDWDLLARHPRAYVGYSDLTPFLLQVVERLGWVSFHGPMVAADLARGLEPVERESLLAALAGELPATYPLGGFLHAGTAEGPLLGGCLSLLGAVAGTPYFPDLEGAILVVEEVHEHLYRLDRLLAQLRLTGSLETLSGVVLGQIDLVSGQDEETWRQLSWDAFRPYRWPSAHGLDFGHLAPNLTLPLGMRARLDEGSQSLQVGIE